LFKYDSSYGGKFGGMAFRVPTPTVSVIDFTAVLGQETTRKNINVAMQEYATGDMAGILGTPRNLWFLQTSRETAGRPSSVRSTHWSSAAPLVRVLSTSREAEYIVPDRVRLGRRPGLD
jgi:glyceraldehyde-3-phosphate dehydrogenase/erythrose-4-phosphate dehydrogenase